MSKTQVQALNKLLEAYGHLNAKQSTFRFQLRWIKNDRIEGYVKSFPKDVQVYDPEKESDKQTSKKIYEAVINGVLGVFKSKPTGQVATETNVSGAVENPKASTWQILEKLVENAFFKAILPEYEKSKKV